MKNLKDFNWENLPKKAILSRFKIKTQYSSNDEALKEFHLLKLIHKHSIKNVFITPAQVLQTIRTLEKSSSIFKTDYHSTKYDVKIEDIVNALNNLELIVAEYFNLDKQAEENDEEDEGIDPENRHLGEPGLIPASSNENVTSEVGRKSISAKDFLSALKDLLDQLMNPADVDDERITDPESVKDSNLVRDEEHPPTGDPRTSPEALDDFDKKESATLENREVLPGENDSQNPDSLVYDEGNPEPNPINPEASSENDGPLQSSGEAYLSMPSDVKPEDEDNEEEKAKDSQTENKSPNAEQGSKEETAKTTIIGEEDDDDDEQGGVGGENNTPAQVGWFDSKAINTIASKKGLDHYKANDDGYISSHGLVSFSNFGKSSIEDYYPDDEELGEINANHSLVNMKKEDVIVLPIVAADTDVDRGGEHFTKDALESFVPLYKGKALLLDHNWTTDHEVGRIFDAKVINDKLIVKSYIPNNEFNKKLINNVLSGVHSRASVGFSMDIRNVTCDSCAKGCEKKGPPTQGPLESSGYFGVSIFDEDNCPHKPGALDEYGNKTTVTLHKVADVMELSFVPVPMQPKAGTNRNLSFSKALNVDNEVNTISSNIISSRTMGEKAVSDLTAPREGHEGEATVPAAAGPFDVEGNQHRPTDDNIFARAAMKNLHDISESLKTLTSELVASTEALKAAMVEYKAMTETKAQAESDEDEEKEDKVKILEEATKALTEVVKKQLEVEVKTQEVETPKSSGAWLTSLVNDFNKNLGS